MSSDNAHKIWVVFRKNMTRSTPDNEVRDYCHAFWSNGAAERYIRVKRELDQESHDHDEFEYTMEMRPVHETATEALK